MIKRLVRTKTFWSGVAGIITAIADMAGVNIPNEVYIIVGLVATMFVRDGIEKMRL